jgi:hypothetical protein
MHFLRTTHVDAFGGTPKMHICTPTLIHVGASMLIGAAFAHFNDYLS